MPKAILRLDRDLPFGTIFGSSEDGAKYMQHGLYFSADGRCVTTAPKSLEAATALIDAELTPVLDTQPIRYAPKGGGKYDVYNAEGGVVAESVELPVAATMVPQQFRDDLGTKARSDLIAHLNLLGGSVLRGDPTSDLIDRIVEFTTELASPPDPVDTGVSAASVPSAPKPRQKKKNKVLKRAEAAAKAVTR